jgi:hypothetical protein
MLPVSERVTSRNAESLTTTPALKRQNCSSCRLLSLLIQARSDTNSLWFQRKGCRVNQHSADTTTHTKNQPPSRFRQLLPLFAAMLPVLFGLGFQAAGTRPQLLKNKAERPPLAFHQYMVNLGDVPIKRSHAAAFSFTNHGEQAIKLRRLETSCGCLTQQFEQDVVAPGEDGYFRLWIQTASQSAGNKQYTCQAIYGPVDDPTVEYKADLIFHITLPEQSVVVTPKAMIFHQPNSQVTERPVDVTDFRSKRLRILEATTQSKLLQVNVLDPSILTNKEREEGVVGRLNVAVGAVPPGTHNAVILIKTDDDEFDQLVVPVRIFGPETTTDASFDHTDNNTAEPRGVPVFED